MTHPEEHRTHRVGWLRAAVLGANDGIVSTASLIVGVAAANTTQDSILLAGIAGLVAGSMSMAAGEYVSVSSQADTERADLELEKRSLDENEELERQELARIYEDRGVTPDVAKVVAEQLMAHDALGAHARDEIGITETLTARPLQAAASSASMFALGAALPLAAAWFAPGNLVLPSVTVIALFCLALLGGVAARVGGASVVVGVARVTFWGAMAMMVTAAIGSAVDVVL